MPELRFEGHVYQVDDYDTVLNTLLKHGHAIPNFCRSGICHSCMMKAEEGTPLPFTQIGLSDELVAENYFLTCQCAVYAPLAIRRPDKDKRTRFVAMVRQIERLDNNLVRLQLSPEHEFEYRAGQFTTLTNVDGLIADIPIASVHGEGRMMEFHIDGREGILHRYVVEELEVGDGLEIQTALGEHYYDSQLNGRDILVVAVDTAAAGGLSLLKSAAEMNHSGHLTMLFGQLDTTQGYSDLIAGELVQSGTNIDFETRQESEAKALADGLVCNLIDKSGEGAEIFVAAPPAIANVLLSRITGSRSLAIDSLEPVIRVMGD